MDPNHERDAGRQPRPGDFALVQLRDFRCMAVYRKNGKWHAAYCNNEPLKIVEIVEFLSAS